MKKKSSKGNGALRRGHRVFIEGAEDR
jgi:hypothetical protein